MAGQVSKWWLDRRNMIVLYRGQEIAATPILSPIARTQGLVASENLLARLRSAGMSDHDIATSSATIHTLPLPPDFPGGLGGLPAGSVGIPATGLPGIAGGFAQDGVIYVIRIPKSLVVRPTPWPVLRQEDEFTLFNQVPPGTIVKVIPGRQIPSLRVDDDGLLAPGR